MAKEKAQKFRYFGFLVCQTDRDGNVNYQTREELTRKLRNTFGDFCISPLHQPDSDDGTDFLHWHVVYRHPNTVAIEFVRNWVQEQGLEVYNNFVLGLHHPRNYQRYLVHLDNPEKEQFHVNDIEVVNNFPLDLSKEMSETERFEMQMEIESFIDDYNVMEYSVMCMFLRQKGYTDHYRYFTTHTNHFSKYLDSVRNAAKAKSVITCQPTDANEQVLIKPEQSR